MEAEGLRKSSISISMDKAEPGFSVPPRAVAVVVVGDAERIGSSCSMVPSSTADLGGGGWLFGYRVGWLVGWLYGKRARSPPTHGHNHTGLPW